MPIHSPALHYPTLTSTTLLLPTQTVAEFLVSAGADTNLCSSGSKDTTAPKRTGRGAATEAMARTPLQAGVVRGHSQVIDFLLSHGCDGCAQGAMGLTALHLACMQVLTHAACVVVPLLQTTTHLFTLLLLPSGPRGGCTSAP